MPLIKMVTAFWISSLSPAKYNAVAANRWYSFFSSKGKSSAASLAALPTDLLEGEIPGRRLLVTQESFDEGLDVHRVVLPREAFLGPADLPLEELTGALASMIGRPDPGSSLDQQPLVQDVVKPSGVCFTRRGQEVVTVNNPKDATLWVPEQLAKATPGLMKPASCMVSITYCWSKTEARRVP